MASIVEQQEMDEDGGSTWVISNENGLFRNARARETDFEDPESRTRRHQKDCLQRFWVINSLNKRNREEMVRFVHPGLEGFQRGGIAVNDKRPALRVYDLMLSEYDELVLRALRPSRVLPLCTERTRLGTSRLCVVHSSSVHEPSLVKVGRNVKAMDLEISTSWNLNFNQREYSFKFSKSSTQLGNSDKNYWPLRVLMWNARGTFRPDFIHILRDVIAFNCPSVLVIVGTFTTLTQAFDNIAQIGFQHAVISDPLMFSGGLWVLWKTGRVVNG